MQWRGRISSCSVNLLISLHLLLNRFTGDEKALLTSLTRWDQHLTIGRPLFAFYELAGWQGVHCPVRTLQIVAINRTFHSFDHNSQRPLNGFNPGPDSWHAGWWWGGWRDTGRWCTDRYIKEGANVQQRDEKWTVHFTPFNFLNCRREAKTTPSILYHELWRWPPRRCTLLADTGMATAREEVHPFILFAVSSGGCEGGVQRKEDSTFLEFQTNIMKTHAGTGIRWSWCCMKSMMHSTSNPQVHPERESLLVLRWSDFSCNRSRISRTRKAINTRSRPKVNDVRTN